jgi:hypothetical protein
MKRSVLQAGVGADAKLGAAGDIPLQFYRRKPR